MNALIIEDEKAAVRNLTALLSEAAPHIGVVAVLDSIAESIDWFRANAMPDLIFLDIHLADGSAFEIFEHVDISCPIIFTTAYDEYALRAFKVNSIDYLLKPIGGSDIRKAIGKLEQLRSEAPQPPDSCAETAGKLQDAFPGSGKGGQVASAVGRYDSVLLYQ